MADPTQRRFRGAAKINEYEIMKEKLGEGTFGVVSKAQSKRTGKIVALKKILMHNEKDGFPITALREVKLLKMLCHPNILRLEEMAVERQPPDEKGKVGKKRATLYMVMPYADHDLSGMLTNPSINFTEPQIKCYMQQLLEGLRYLHDSHILHRDMKAANILISNSGILQIADFGLARHYDGTTPQPGAGNGEAVRDYTSLVVTRWYRPPELLLTLKRYTPAIDLWGVGCIFGEMYERKPILEGRTDVDQCVRIFQLVGSPNEQSMPGWDQLGGCDGTKNWEARRGDIDQRFGPRMSREGLDLLKTMLCLDWRRRTNAFDALQHKYFKSNPLPSRPEDLPKYEDSHELDSRNRGKEQRKQPPAPAGGTVGMGPDEHPYNAQYGYNDRGPPRGGYPRDRPPQQPPRGYDDRRGAPLPPTNGSRQPGWRQDDRGRPANGHSHPLPPKPNGYLPAVGGPPPPRRDGRNDVDTYVPSYRPNDGYDRDRDRDRDRGYRDADAPPTRNYRDTDRGFRDADYPPARGDGRGDYRRTRSRSPERDAARRERLQDRERDLYRR